MTLMEMLIKEGYPKEEFFHHYSNLYIFATPMTQRVVNQWCKENGYHRGLFVSTFHDQQTGRLMYDVAFQYDPFWEGERALEMEMYDDDDPEQCTFSDMILNS